MAKSSTSGRSALRRLARSCAKRKVVLRVVLALALALVLVLLLLSRRVDGGANSLLSSFTLRAVEGRQRARRGGVQNDGSDAETRLVKSSLQLWHCRESAAEVNATNAQLRHRLAAQKAALRQENAKAVRGIALSNHAAEASAVALVAKHSHHAVHECTRRESELQDTVANLRVELARLRASLELPAAKGAPLSVLFSSGVETAPEARVPRVATGRAREGAAARGGAAVREGRGASASGASESGTALRHAELVARTMHERSRRAKRDGAADAAAAIMGGSSGGAGGSSGGSGAGDGVWFDPLQP
jgi:hypothetical protein